MPGVSERELEAAKALLELGADLPKFVVDSVTYYSESESDNERSSEVGIGVGGTKVPARVLNNIDWSSYPSATRQLLRAVFPRKVLATHSLTGKASPAFPDRPPKKLLNKKIVADVISTVVENCGVPKSYVRKIITIKCADEAKLYRKRKEHIQAHRRHRRDENCPPAPEN